MTTYSAIFFSHGEYKRILCSTYEESLLVLDACQIDRSTEPIGIYEVRADKFEWHLRRTQTAGYTFGDLHRAGMTHTISRLCESLRDEMPFEKLALHSQSYTTSLGNVQTN